MRVELEPTGIPFLLMVFACIALGVGFANTSALIRLKKDNMPLPWSYLYRGGMAWIFAAIVGFVLYINPLAMRLETDQKIVLEYLWPRRELVVIAENLSVSKTKRWDGWVISSREGMGSVVVYRKDSNVVQQINGMSIPGVRLE